MALVCPSSTIFIWLALHTPPSRLHEANRLQVQASCNRDGSRDGLGRGGFAAEEQVQSMDLSLPDLALFPPPHIYPSVTPSFRPLSPLLFCFEAALQSPLGTRLDKQNSQIRLRSREGRVRQDVIHLVKPVIAFEYKSSRIIDRNHHFLAEWFGVMSNSFEFPEGRRMGGGEGTRINA